MALHHEYQEIGRFIHQSLPIACALSLLFRDLLPVTSKFHCGTFPHHEHHFPPAPASDAIAVPAACVQCHKVC